MSLFWRILFAFVITVAITFIGQRWVGASESRLPTFPLLTMAGSPLVEATGQSALINVDLGDRASALHILQPIEDSGIHAWIVTKEALVGSATLQPEVLNSARVLLNTGQIESLPFGYRMTKLNGDGILVLLVPGFNSAPHLAWRALLLIAIPVIIGLWLAKHLSFPIEQISAAATKMASGDLSARAGRLSGPKVIQSLGGAFDLMASQVQKTLVAQRRLLIDVSHETRSPLTRIRLAAKMLAEGKGTLENNTAHIERDVVRLDELIGTISTFVRPDEAIELDQRFNLANVAEDVLQVLRVEAEEKQIRFKVKFVETFIIGNHLLVRSAIENVTRNAIIHSSNESVVDVLVSNNPAKVQVLDRGPGVSIDELTKIFEPFYRQSEARERDSGGTGLGLAIANRAATLHGGRAYAEQREGGGLIVTIEFEA